MPDDIVVATPDATVSVPQDSELEIDTAWLESLSGSVSQIAASIQVLGTATTQMLEQHSRMLEMLSSLQSRLPENLTVLISQQQVTITSLTEQVQQIATRILEADTLTPPAPPTPEPEPVPVVVENPEAAISSEPPAPPKRRKI